MTDAQLARLPETLREIVLVDRRRATLKSAPVACFNTWRELRAARLRLREKAVHLWGYQLGGDKAAGA